MCSDQSIDERNRRPCWAAACFPLNQTCADHWPKRRGRICYKARAIGLNSLPVWASPNRKISAAETRNSSEESALQIARNDLTSVDPYSTATKLQETQTQLETIYALTARMSHLSLLDYL